MVRHDRGENTGTWGLCLAALFLLIALSVSHEWRISPARLACGTNRKRKPCSQRIHLSQAGWAAAALTHGWAQHRKRGGLSAGWAPFLRRALGAGWWKRKRERWRCSHSVPGSLIRGAYQEVPHVVCELPFLWRSMHSALLLIISPPGPAGTLLQEDQWILSADTRVVKAPKEAGTWRLLGNFLDRGQS